MAHLAEIRVYPIKSLDPVALSTARVLNSGALRYDRQWAIVDASGKFLNGKRIPLVHQLRVAFDDSIEHVRFDYQTQTASFALGTEVEAMEAWLSQVFSQPVRIVENASAGFPDDTEAPGPTVISTATLEMVASWFPPTTLDECRLRFRANLEIDGVEPFWEDQLFGRAGSEVGFSIGGVNFLGTNPCQRCAVPSRHPLTGEVWPKFSVEFGRRREANFPAWAMRERFDHFYRLAVNTHLAGRGGTISTGEPVSLTSSYRFRPVAPDF
jgi:uncharacterized protein YcbX